MQLPQEKSEYKLAAYNIFLFIWAFYAGAALWGLIWLLLRLMNHADRNILILLAIYTPSIAYSLPLVFNVFHCERLVLSKDGISHKTLFFTLFVEWGRVIRVDHFKHGSKCLVIEQTQIEKTKNKWIRVTHYARSLSDMREFIPLGGKNWANNDRLEAEIKIYAPNLDI